MDKVLRSLVTLLGARGATANVAASLEDRRSDLALVDEACRRLAGRLPVEGAAAA
jgi:hypothetical protein